MTVRSHDGDPWRRAWFRATVRRLGLALRRVAAARRTEALRATEKAGQGPRASDTDDGTARPRVGHGRIDGA